MAERVQFEVDRSTGGGIQLVLGDVGAWTLSGLSADDVQLLRTKTSSRKRDSEEEKEPSLLAQFDSIRARVQLMSLLGGSKLLDLKGEGYDGAIELLLGVSGGEGVFEMEAQDLDLSQYPAHLPDGEALQLTGRLQAESDLRIHFEDTEESSGSLRLEIDGFGILNEAFADTFSEAVVELEAEDGRLVVNKGKFEGDKISAELSGEIVLKKRISRSKVDLQLKVQLDSSYELLANAAGYKRARDSEGYYHFKCTGTLDRRRCRKDTASARGNRRDSSSRRDRRRGGRRDRDADGGSAGGGIGDRVRPDESAEERRERRQERIRERRRKARERRESGGEERLRPDASRSQRRGRRPESEEIDDLDPEDDLVEEEPPFDDEAPLPDDLEDMDEDFEEEELGDEPYLGD